MPAKELREQLESKVPCMGLVLELAPWIMQQHIETILRVVVPPKESSQKQLVKSTLDGLVLTLAPWIIQ